MNYLNNLSKQQRYWLIAAVAVGAYALYVRSQRRSSPPVALEAAGGGTGAVYGEQGLDLSSISSAINAALGQQQQGYSTFQTGLTNLIEGAVEGLSSQNTALANAIQDAAEGNAAALTAFQQAETASLTQFKTDIGSQITQGVTALSNALNTGFQGQGAALTAGFNAQKSETTSLFNALKSFVETQFGGVNTALTAQMAKIDQSVTAVNNLAPKLEGLPKSDMLYLLMGAQTTASCFGPNDVGSLECYNSKAPFDGLRYIGGDSYQSARPAVEQRWGQYRKSDGTYDLVAIGKAVNAQRGSGDTGGGPQVP